MRYEEKVKKIIEEYIDHGGMTVDKFPDMEIYMDQATVFMNRKLAIYKKYPKDLVMTKTMIGNYVKHKLIPRPKEKKYCKDHLILLTFIYYLKSAFQMDEIENLMKPIIANYNSEFDEKISISDLYEGISALQKEKRQTLLKDTMEDIYRIKDNNNKMEIADDDILELFMLIVDLSMKVDYQRYLAQSLLNEYFVKSKSKASQKPKKI